MQRAMTRIRHVDGSAEAGRVIPAFELFSFNMQERITSMTIRPFVLMFLLAFLASGGHAAEVKVSSAYLEGKWVLGEKQACGSGDAEYLLMRRNGTVEMGKGGSARIVGFWEVNNDDLTLHMLVSPETVTGQNPFYRESYRYQYVTAKVVEMKPDAFGVIVTTNVEAGIQTLSRCP